MSPSIFESVTRVASRLALLLGLNRARRRAAIIRNVALVVVVTLGDLLALSAGAAADEPHGIHTDGAPAKLTGECGEGFDSWHPPVIDGCATGHEHGDAPPSWIADAGYTVSFSGPFNTSAMENSHKHAGMKGFLARFNEIDVYFRVHASSNVLDRAARYHSYEVWTRDPAGGVSHWQGWYDTGDPVLDRVPRSQGDPGRRPAMLVVDLASWNSGIKCEQWYANTASWSWDFGWTICGINALYYAGENAEQDQASWRLPPDGAGVGGVRRLEAAWYGNSMSGRESPVGQFWATQFGELVTGPADPRCSMPTVRFGQAYDTVCLDQFIAPTMGAVKYPDNATQKAFDTTGARSPN